MYIVNKQLYNNQIKTIIVVENAEISEEEVENLKKSITDVSKTRIVMDRSLALSSPGFFDTLCSAFPGIDVFVKVDDVEYDVNFKESQIFDNAQMDRLIQNNAIINKYGGELYLSAYTYGDDPLGRENKIPFSRVVQANSKMNNWVNRINNAKVDGKPLSPFEKYLYAYQIVTEFKYSEDQIFEARDISRILSGKFIVCAGYASILSELCRRVGIVCKRQFVHAEESENEENQQSVANHECCVLKLEDPKYNIDGFFLADPTLDSYDYAVEDGTTLTHALIGLDEYEKLNNGREHLIVDDNSNMSNFYFLRDSKILPNEKTFFESNSPKKDVEKAVKYNYFDESFGQFIQSSAKYLNKTEGFKSYTLMPKEFKNIYLIDSPYSTEDISKSSTLLSNLALKTFSTANIDDQNANELKRFFYESLDTYLNNNNIQINDDSIKNVSKYLMDTAKNDEQVLSDSQLLYSLAEYNDANVIFNCNTRQKFEEILNTHYDKVPTIKNYLDALKNVYMASGGDKESSSALADFMVNASVWLADALGWSKKDVTNVFAKEAKLTKPIETLKQQRYEEIAKNSENDNLTPEKLENMLKDKKFAELKKLGVDLDNQDEVYQFERIRLCGVKLKNKLGEDTSISLE